MIFFTLWQFEDYLCISGMKACWRDIFMNKNGKIAIRHSSNCSKDSKQSKSAPPRPNLASMMEKSKRRVKLINK